MHGATELPTLLYFCKLHTLMYNQIALSTDINLYKTVQDVCIRNVDSCLNMRDRGRTNITTEYILQLGYLFHIFLRFFILIYLLL